MTESRDEVGPEVTALRDAGVELELGGHRDDTLRNAALVVLSPGVPPTEQNVGEKLSNVLLA